MNVIESKKVRAFAKDRLDLTMSAQWVHWPQSGLMQDWQILHETLLCFSTLIFSFTLVRFRLDDDSGETKPSFCKR